MMKRTLLIVAVLCVCGSSFAGLVPDSWWASWGDTSNLGRNTWAFEEEALTWNIDEKFDALGSASFSCGGATNEDPDILITKTIENGSDVAWTSFVVEIDPTGGASYVAGSAEVVGDHLNTITEQNIGGVDVITFEAPDSVLVGETLEISFKINIPANTIFTIDVEQTPVPEPASLSILSLGAVFLARRKK